MKKCEVIVDRVSLIVNKGSIVEVDDIQFELARQFLKPVGKVAKEEVAVEEAQEEKPVKEKKKK